MGLLTTFLKVHEYTRVHSSNALKLMVHWKYPFLSINQRKCHKFQWNRDVTFILKTTYDDCRLWEYRSIHPAFYWLLSTPWEYRSINSESYWLLSIRLVGYFMKKLRITHHGFTHTETHLEAMIRRGVQKHSDKHLVYNRRTSNT